MAYSNIKKKIFSYKIFKKEKKTMFSLFIGCIIKDNKKKCVRH